MDPKADYLGIVYEAPRSFSASLGMTGDAQVGPRAMYRRTPGRSLPPGTRRMTLSVREWRW